MVFGRSPDEPASRIREAQIQAERCSLTAHVNAWRQTLIRFGNGSIRSATTIPHSEHIAFPGDGTHLHGRCHFGEPYSATVTHPPGASAAASS